MRRIRLKYRYLDLRNPEVKKNIVLRSKVVAALQHRHGVIMISWRSPRPSLRPLQPRGCA